MNRPEVHETASEQEMMERLLPLNESRILELGCGAAWIIRQLAVRYSGSRFIATEVDRIQHERNLATPVAANLDFRFGGAEAIDAEPDSVDVVCMLKSLHHVPLDLMPAAMDEIVRVLKPGGLVYFSEPVYAGEFNALLSMIHDEKLVRTQAFEAIRGLVDSGRMRLLGEYFFNIPGRYASWEVFEERFLNVTHTELRIDTERYEKIKQAFLTHMGAEGAEFLKPHRVDLLQKP
jgi:SAM-dependent methyltransferase